MTGFLTIIKHNHACILALTTSRIHSASEFVVSKGLTGELIVVCHD